MADAILLTSEASE